MSIQHLHYVVNEIDAAYQFIKIDNCTFYKRAVSRLIAIRVDDFLKIAFRTNNATLNSSAIRDDLNALQELYNEYFKLQRDKYGAHFQFLNLGERLQNWADIDLTKATFFYETPKTIYEQFATLPDYMPLTNILISEVDLKTVSAVNEKMDIEKHPNFSNDILSLTRPNTGGIINFGELNAKAGTLKSLELLIDYSIEVLNALPDTSNIKSVFIKLFITDLVSYTDNFYTRLDVPQGTKQHEYGLDHYLSLDAGYTEAHKIVLELKKKFKVQEHIDELRIIRNKSCGHIDLTVPVADIVTSLISVNIEKFIQFYECLKQTFVSVCHSSLCLNQYLISAREKIHGVSKMVALDVVSFDGKQFPDTAIEIKSANDIAEYDVQYSQWIEHRGNDARQFFWRCFSESEVIRRVEIPISNGHTFSRFHDYRLAHKYFEDKLRSNVVGYDEKIGIIELFIACGGGYPETSAYILSETFPDDFKLQVHFIRGIGKLSGNRSDIILKRAEHLYHSGNLVTKCVVLKALFDIDITARRDMQGKHTSETSTYSDFIKNVLRDSSSSFQQLCLSLVLGADFIFSRHYLSDSLDVFYKNFIAEQFRESLKALSSSHFADVDVSNMINYYNNNYFSTLVAVLSDMFLQNGMKEEEETVLKLLAYRHIQFAEHNEQELHNLAVIYFKLSLLNEAIDVAIFLVKNYPYKVGYNYLLLNLYSNDNKYEDDFNRVKQYVLSNFNLTIEERSDFSNIQMENRNV